MADMFADCRVGGEFLGMAIDGDVVSGLWCVCLTADGSDAGGRARSLSGCDTCRDECELAIGPFVLAGICDGDTCFGRWLFCDGRCTDE